MSASSAAKVAQAAKEFSELAALKAKESTKYMVKTSEQIGKDTAEKASNLAKEQASKGKESLDKIVDFQGKSGVNGGMDINEVVQKMKENPGEAAS